jgi:aryl-alcohol dehydrogenase-like predicted oxidoreductase
MRYRLFGPTGLRVSELFLGAMRFTTTEQARPIVDRYADAGGNMIDTADAYGSSEDVLGEVLTGRRDRFVLASKYTLPDDAVRRLDAATAFSVGFPHDFITPDLLDPARIESR